MFLLYLISPFVLIIAIKLYNKYSCVWCDSLAIMACKVVIVTGANSGIGYETALDLARRGAKVILACRDDRRGQAAAEDVIKKTGNKNVFYKNLDLASLDSIRKFAEDFKRTENKLDVLINNAGGIGYRKEKTADGILLGMQTNYFGPFLLTILLVPLLKKAESGRIIMVSSVMHKYGSIDFDALNEESRWRDIYGNEMYSCSKLCAILFSNELARRLKDTRITVNSVHPGFVRTSIANNYDGITKIFLNFVYSALFRNPIEGAQTVIYLAVSEDLGEVTGKYFADCKESKASKTAMDEELASQLWRYSEQLVKLKPEEALM